MSTDSAAGDTDFVQRALDHAQEVSPALGLTSRGREFVADPHTLKTSAGGRAVNLQLVVDALKLTPPNPSLLAARDAIFLALDHTHAAGDAVADVAATLPDDLERPLRDRTGPELERHRAPTGYHPADRG
ncbi:MAG: M36 family metallopeptidase [Pseudonocardiaceae bacterium]